MPGKACERWFIHVIAFAHFFSKCPKIEEFHFRFLFCFKIDHVHFFRNARFSYHIRLALFLKCPFFPFQNQIGKIGHFEKNFETEKKPKMKFFDFRAFRKKWTKAITWQNHLSHAFPGISKYSPYSIE